MTAPNPLPSPAARPPWQMPIIPGAYDRCPLTEDELEALGERRRLADHGDRSRRAQTLRIVLQRLMTPLVDVALRCGQGGPVRGGLVATKTVMCNEMLHRRCAFWQWTADDWIATVAPTSPAYTHRHFAQYGYPASAGRGMVRMAAYFLGEVSDLHAAGVGRDATRAAQIAFGRDVIAADQERVRAVLAEGEGYSSTCSWLNVRNLLSLLALQARSPYLEDIALEALIALAMLKLADLCPPLPR
ncbi:MAG: hypothetical protein NVSMB65_19000 [Chloroflexota bacterium]